MGTPRWTTPEAGALRWGPQQGPAVLEGCRCRLPASRGQSHVLGGQAGRCEKEDSQRLSDFPPTNHQRLTGLSYRILYVPFSLHFSDNQSFSFIQLSPLLAELCLSNVLGPPTQANADQRMQV